MARSWTSTILDITVGSGQRAFSHEFFSREPDEVWPRVLSLGTGATLRVVESKGRQERQQKDQYDEEPLHQRELKRHQEETPDLTKLEEE